MSNSTVAAAMKLSEVKKRVERTWRSLHIGYTIHPGKFEQDIKAFGDRRYKQTWITAMCRYEAMMALESCLDAWMLLISTFDFQPERWDYDYRHQILDEFLMYPEALEIIKTGLEDLFQMDFSTEEREKANGFFKLLEERTGENRITGSTVKSFKAINRSIAA